MRLKNMIPSSSPCGYYLKRKINDFGIVVSDGSDMFFFYMNLNTIQYNLVRNTH